ncbi:CaiB/BaiF CoA-transferase family protein [Leifsonia kafniensis]|uniref:CaiB/BaiF CoA-transferase family protein n=1 Tax=Leifsonia kafniensis TaxID=475957 RepID=A0ABP7KEL2_9MICO
MSESHTHEFDQPRSGPLSGVVIVDFTRVLAGPYCTMLLGDMGATIIKVESPAGDDTRSWMPPVVDDEATYFLSVNRNKHSVVLDLADPADQATAAELISHADVVVENFKAGGMARFGLDYDTVSADHAGLIYASITGFGTGLGAKYAGYDLSVQAISGMMSLTGGAETEPYRVGVALFDVMTGMHTAIGILGALHHRDETGAGQQIELNLLTSALSSLVNQSAAYAMAGVVPTRMGNQHPSLYPYEPFPAADGDIIVAVGNDAQFRRLCTLVEVPELADDVRFQTVLGRNTHRDDLRILLRRRLITESVQHWFDELTALGVPCAPINTLGQGIDFADQIGLEPIVVAGTDERAIRTIRHPVSYSRTPASYEVAPPLLGSAHGLVMDWLNARRPAAPETAGTETTSTEATSTEATSTEATSTEATSTETANVEGDAQ